VGPIFTKYPIFTLGVNNSKGVKMAQFIFNEGSEHRGVWHLVDTEAVLTVVPEKVKEFTEDVVTYHLNTCASNSPRYIGFPDYKYTYLSCDCGEGGKILGQWTYRYVTPEHVIAEATVACPAFNHASYDKNVPARKMALKTGGISYTLTPRRSYKVLPSPGDDVTYTYGIDKVYLVEGDNFPVGPACSRCERILEKRKNGTA
jgi:hypothetical protein